MILLFFACIVFDFPNLTDSEMLGLTPRVYMRSLDEVTAPFRGENGPVDKFGLRLDHAEIKEEQVCLAVVCGSGKQVR